MAKPEGLIQHAILDYLAKLEMQGKLMFWRQNNTGVWDARAGCYRKPSGPGARLGVPDIMVILPPHGQLMGIECKAPKGVQSGPQSGFQRQCEKLGAAYCLAKSIDDVVAALAASPKR